MASFRYLLPAALLLACSVHAQLPEDVLRYGFPLAGGTARSQAIGGAIGALGGDITSSYVNPAGLGMYKNKEFVLSPNFGFLRNRFDYRGSNTSARDNGVGYGPIGFVLGSQSSYRRNHSSAFAISINQIANYNNTIQYSGFNNTSSWSEQYVEELVRNRATVPQAENNFIFGSSLAFWTFLVDTIANAQGQVIGYQSVVPLPSGPGGTEGVNQINRINTSGGAHEVSLGYGTNNNDKFHFGFSFNIPFYSYRRDQTYREEDASGNPNNDFAYFEYRERYRTSGVGFNGKLGLIARPTNRLRLGLALHTPTFANLNDQISSSIEANTEGFTVFPQPQTKTSDELKGNNSNAGNYKYNIITPWRMLGSVAFVINEVKEIKQQKGFISADIEYVNYRSTRYRADDPTMVDDVAYYNQLNETIKSRYRGAFNFRVGGELKFKTLMTRLGFAHLGSPFSREFRDLRGNRTLLSGGLGYRNRGMFIDLTYVHAIVRQNEVPYWLQDKANPIADGRNSRGNIVLTLGFKLM